MTRERQEQATPDTWMCPPEGGWSYGQVKYLDLPFDWELVDGEIVPRGMTQHWHDETRDAVVGMLRQAKRHPFAANSERCVLLNAHTVIKPDVVVYDKTGLNRLDLECVPVENVKLTVEVVSPGSRSDDTFRKPGILAECGVPYYWRVERGDDGAPVVHEFWWHQEAGTYAPADRPTHRGRLKTDVPFPVDVDLRGLVDF